MSVDIVSPRNPQSNPVETLSIQGMRRMRGLRRTIQHAIARGDRQLARDLAKIAERMAREVGQ